MTSPESRDVQPGEIEVRSSARAANIAPVRVVAAELAARADFDVDAISDLRMAVDEACAELVQLAEDGATLTCRFRLGDEGMEVTAFTTPRDGAKFSLRSFGWHVLTALVDDVTPITADGLAGIRLCKRRGEGPDDKGPA